jgi:hypothetical protein
MGTMQADLETSIANQNDAAIKTKNETKVDQQQTTQIPHANPTAIIPHNTSANVHINQVTSNDITDSSHLSANYTNDISTDRTMETHITNAVTQNFTKESLSQLSQIVNSNQDIGIDVEGVGGSVTIRNIENSSNIILRQTMTSSMNVGNAVVQTLANTMALETDDAATTKNTEALGLTSKTDLRTGNAASGDMTTSLDYKQIISQDFGMGSCGSSASSCISCIICIVCILSCGLGAMGGGGGGDSEITYNQVPYTGPAAVLPGNRGTSVGGSSSENETSIGGYYYFN